MSDPFAQKQEHPFYIKHLICIVVLLSCVSGLVACGKRAGRIDPPPEVTEDTFPRTYPDPALDPKPTYKPAKVLNSSGL